MGRVSYGLEGGGMTDFNGSGRVPASMAAELQQWNQGKGTDLETWVGCVGNFSLAVGYLEIFCPRFVRVGSYVVRDQGLPADELERHVNAFAARPGIARQQVEEVVNHIHLDGIQYVGCKDISADKLLFVGQKLKRLYEALLAWDFPDVKCVVEFQVPSEPDDFDGYVLSFWQA
jgi:hypothetical protein